MDVADGDEASGHPWKGARVDERDISCMSGEFASVDPACK